LFWQKAYCAFDVLMITKIYLFRYIEAFFHANAEISYPLDLFSLYTITNGKLWYPYAIYEFLLIFNNIIKNEVEKNK